MRYLLLFLFLTSVVTWAYKPLPPGGGASVNPNVLFVIDTSGSMNSPMSPWYSNEAVCLGQTYLDDSSNDSRTCKTKRALLLLLLDETKVSNMNIGLTRFPNRGDNEILDVPVRSIDTNPSTGTHLDRFKSQTILLPARGGTPIASAINLARDYYLGNGYSKNICRSVANVYGTGYCASPVTDKCQKNYVIIFTDGQTNYNSTITAAQNSADPLQGLSSLSVDGNSLADSALPVYFIGLNLTSPTDKDNMNDYAAAGGTTNAYFADSDPSSILTVFDTILKDIEAKNITATTPTLIPGFAGPENDVLYLNSFKAKEGKQWEGHLYKYHLSETGLSGDVLGAYDWDFYEKLKIQVASDDRKIYTVCRKMDDSDTFVKEFNLLNGKDLAFCMLKNNTGAAGKPMNAKIVVENDWQSPNNIVANCSLGSCYGGGDSDCWDTIYDGNNVVNGCMPRREWIDPTCIDTENIVDMIKDQYDSYKSLCNNFVDFEDFSGASCTGDKASDARLIQRYLCQSINSLCGCFKRWDGEIGGNPSNGQAKSCNENDNNYNNSNECGDTDVMDEDGKRDSSKRSCYNGYCVGAPKLYDDNSTWLKAANTNYDHDLSAKMVIQGNNSNKTGIVRLNLSALKFNSDSNSIIGSGNTVNDYLIIEEKRNGDKTAYHIITTRKDNTGTDQTLIYSCVNGQSVTGVGNSNFKIPGTCDSKPIAESVSLTFPTDFLTTQQLNDGKYYRTRKLELYFHSDDDTKNDLAFNVNSYNFKPEDEITTSWGFSGGENENKVGREKLDKKDIEDIMRLIDFYRGKDSFEENTDTKCKYKESGRKGSCPDRKYPLGDIYNSRVQFMGTPNQMYTYAGYRVFQRNNIKTLGESLLLVGGNDGMLHAINPTDASGKEKWAFIPPSLLSRLQDIVVGNTNDKTASQFFVDSSVKIMDVCDNCSASESNWKRVLVMGFGEGQEGLMALDLTDLDNPIFLWAVMNETPLIYKSPLYNQLENCETFKRVLVWDKNGNIRAYSENIPDPSALAHDRNDNEKMPDSDFSLSDNKMYDYSRLGKTWSEPIISQIGGTDTKTGKFVAIIGAGGNYPYKTVNDKEVNNGDNTSCIEPDRVYGSAVYMIDILGAHGGRIITRYNIPSNNNNIPERVPARVSVLPKPQQIDSDGNFISGIQNRITSQIYTSDMSGRIWRMSVSDDWKSIDDSTVHEINCSDSHSVVLEEADKTGACLKLYDNNSTIGNKNYIFKSVAITYDGKTSNSGTDSDSTNIWVFAGTGDTSLEGIKDNSGNNILLAIKDPNWELGEASESGIDISALKEITGVEDTSIENVCDNLPGRGWYYKLDPNLKLVGKPVIVDGYVYYTVYEHGDDTSSSDECSGHLGTSYLYSFKLFSGCHNSAFDKDGDGHDVAASLKVKLGKGIATSPVLRGNTMYFGISGEGEDGDKPINGQAEREGNVIRWDRTNSDSANSNKSSNVPFSYFKEKF